MTPLWRRCMHPRKLTCDFNTLCKELCLWHNGKKVMRFGQQLWNLYGRPGLTWPELFYERDPQRAFVLAFNDINGIKENSL